MFSISSLSDLHSSGSFWQLTHACIVQNLAKIFQWSVNKDSGVYFSAFSFFPRFTSLLSMRSGTPTLFFSSVQHDLMPPWTTQLGENFLKKSHKTQFLVITLPLIQPSTAFQFLPAFFQLSSAFMWLILVFFFQIYYLYL